jgi:hypothetical protein
MRASHGIATASPGRLRASRPAKRASLGRFENLMTCQETLSSEIERLTMCQEGLLSQMGRVTARRERPSLGGFDVFAAFSLVFQGLPLNLDPVNVPVPVPGESDWSRACALL